MIQKIGIGADGDVKRAMIKELLNIANELDSRGLTKEADYLDLLSKKAIPIEGIFELPSTTHKFEDEDGEELEEEEWESGEVVSDPVVSGYKPDVWYGALSSLGASVILIPFETDALEESDIYALAGVFGVSAETYEELKEETNSFSMEASSRVGDRDILKITFPSLWAEISKLLAEKGLPEEKVVYLLFNEDHPPPRGLFAPEKSPHYFSHDIGHIEVDFGENYDMAYRVYGFLQELSKFYKTEDEENEYLLKDQIADDYDDEHFDQEKVQKLISSVFSTFSGEPSDELFDVISNAMAGNLNPEIPDEIWYEGDTYIFLEENKKAAEKLLEEFVESYMKIISDADPSGYGPLMEWMGSVMLYDI